MRVGKIFAKYFNKNISTMEEKDKNINENGCADSTVEGNDVDTNTENAAGEKAAEACPDDKKETPESESAEKEEKDPLTAAKEEIEALKDKYLRSVAEFDNYRKRTMKEKAELILNGSEKAVQAILPVIDDMERALANAEKTDDTEVLKEGMKLIYHKTNKIMESLGVKKIETDNADFDTNFHEAVAMVPGMGDDKKGKVLDCVQTGYTLNDKVIRHAKVAVGQEM